MENTKQDGNCVLQRRRADGNKGRRDLKRDGQKPARRQVVRRIVIQLQTYWQAEGISEYGYAWGA
jgi:hypothetical protein